MATTRPGGITIVGLGPGDGRLLTRQAWELLSAAQVVYLRTERHPAVGNLPSHVRQVSFDHLYETATDFSQVYQQISQEILQLGRSEEGVVYAVPGHPFIAEATVTAIVHQAQAEGLPVTIAPGLSFVEPTLAALQLDGLDGLQLFDAIEIGGYNHPPVNPDWPLLLGQLYSRPLASEVKLSLMAAYPEQHRVALVRAAGTVNEAVDWMPLFEMDRTNQVDHLTSLFVPPLAGASTLAALAETVAILRAPGGCPWDQEQTPESLRPGFLEEA
ncbi:MAG: SAM-dependent methyltransferase, partial [Chloroflexota bacterium]